MNIPIPVFLIWFIIAIFILRHHMRKDTRAQEAVSDAFWKKEESSLVVRKKDLEAEDYVQPTLTDEDMMDGDFYQSIGLPELTRQASYVKALLTQPMVNFAHISNTDLRLTYGTAMLTTISEYEDTFNAYVGTLLKMSEILCETDQLDMAVKFLEECIHLGSDNRKHYLLLAECYQKQGNHTAIGELKEKAAELNTLTKDALIRELEEIE